MARLLPNRLKRFLVDLVAYEPSDMPRLRGSGVSRLEDQTKLMCDGVHVSRPRAPVVRGAPQKLRQALPHGICPNRRQHPRLSERGGASLLHSLLPRIDVIDDRCEDLHPAQRVVVKASLTPEVRKRAAQALQVALEPGRRSLNAPTVALQCPGESSRHLLPHRARGCKSLCTVPKLLVWPASNGFDRALEDIIQPRRVNRQRIQFTQFLPPRRRHLWTTVRIGELFRQRPPLWRRVTESTLDPLVFCVCDSHG